LHVVQAFHRFISEQNRKNEEEIDQHIALSTLLQNTEHSKESAL
jgi:hypothetical protein